MIEMTPEQTAKYFDLAEEHADFLCEKIFKPAFKMAFIHGAKHMQEDLMLNPMTIKRGKPCTEKS